MIKAMFVGFNTDPTTIPFERLYDKGLNSIILHAGYLLGDTKQDQYPNTKIAVESYQTQLEGLDIDIYIDHTPFMAQDGSQASPTDTNYINLCTTWFPKIIEETDAKGIFLDDYFYRDPWYNSNNDSTQSTNLVNFASTIKTALNDVGGILGLETYFLDGYHSAYYTPLSSVVDMFLPEVYIIDYNLGYYGTDPLGWIKRTVNGLKGKVGNTPMVVLHWTTIDNTTRVLHSTSDILEYINMGLVNNVAGYSLESWGYMPTDIIFPSKIVRTPEVRSSVSRTPVNRY